MACIHARRLKREMFRGTSAAVRNQGFLNIWQPRWSFCSFPNSHSSHVEVQINSFSPGKLKGVSALIMLAIDDVKNFWKIFLKLYISSLMFIQNMKWAKSILVVMRTGGPTPSFPKQLLSRLTPPYFHTTEAQMSQHWRTCPTCLLSDVTSDGLASGKP